MPEFHSGNGAIRTHSDGDGQTTIYQDVDVKLGTAYQASVWVRTVDLREKGFGKSPDDSAGLILHEMDAADNVLRKHPKKGIKNYGPHTLLTRTITTGDDTAKVRFALETTIQYHYTEGHVTYDDCSFRDKTGSSSEW